ncbi:MAG: hypothetical protein H8D78_12875 [Chloroflexi bacterium]|nr:hypothetical protein [Chloroflexota bacterium]
MSVMPLVRQVAVRLQVEPEVLERDSLRVYLEKRLRAVESELFFLMSRYGVSSVEELDELIQAGKYHEDGTFEDYFEFDYLQHQQKSLLAALEEV